MKGNLSVAIFILIVGAFLMTACEPKPFTNVHSLIITGIDTRNNKVRLEGFPPTTTTVIKDYAYRVEDDAVYIKILLTSYKYGKHKGIVFEQDLPDNIEKIFIEDDNKRQIMIWEKSQGYDKFEIEDMWKDELKKLK